MERDDNQIVEDYINQKIQENVENLEGLGTVEEKLKQVKIINGYIKIFVPNKEIYEDNKFHLFWQNGNVVVVQGREIK